MENLTLVYKSFNKTVVLKVILVYYNKVLPHTQFDKITVLKVDRVVKFSPHGRAKCKYEYRKHYDAWLSLAFGAGIISIVNVVA